MVSLKLQVLAGLAILLQLLSAGEAQQDFTRIQVPTFRRGVFYPGRVSNALQAEIDTCRAITDRIDRNSARFRSELVTNTNNGIFFSNANSRLMTSRMQTRLDTLASSYFRELRRRMTILKAWTPFPDRDLSNEPESLHYEGRTVRVRLSRSGDYPRFLQLAVASSFDWVYYANSNYVRLSVIPSNCVRNVDAVFMLDRSGSVGAANHQIGLQFMSNVVSFFSIGRNLSRVGTVAYSGGSQIQFDLDDHFTSSSLINAIQRITFTGGATNTPSALSAARTLLNPRNNRGARNNLLGIPKIAILITDGRSNRGSNLAGEARALRDSGVQVYAVGIGNIVVSQLQTIASDPDNQHVFILSSFLDAAGFVDFLSVTTCDTPAVIDPGDPITPPEIPDGGINYFQAECPAFSDKVLVELIDINGTSFLYCSSVETNPGPLTPNTISNETTGIRRRTGLLRLTRDKVVYIGVQGQGQSASFTLIVWDQLFDPADVFIDLVEGSTREVTIYESGQTLIQEARQNNYVYSIIEGNDQRIFSINRNNGRVFIPTTSPGVSFARSRTHNLTVQAQNTAADCQRARIRININVISNRIDFDPLPPRSVPEMTPVNTQIARVVARGGAGEIQYTIESGNTGSAFRIGSGTGRVRVNGNLDFETRPSYTLTIRADSVGTTVTDTISLQISILDINEQHVFTTPCALTSTGCTYRVTENTAASTLQDFNVMDPDSSTSINGTHTYSLSGSNRGDFSLDSNTGVFRTSGALDREAIGAYSFTLTVTDRCSLLACRHSVTTSIRVTVVDVNDNAPVFTFNPPTVEVSEDAAANSVVVQYRATDADIGSNARIEFSVSSSVSNLPFTMNQDTGVLTLTGPIDFETTEQYMVTVTAANPGGVQRTTTQTTIQILNVNDNTPMFQGAPFSGSVVENSPANTAVLTTMAIDRDRGIHGQVTYAIIGGNFNNSFRISGSGSITVRNNIDRETISSFRLTVRARDRGTPQQRSATTVVPITVTDVNDNRPVFSPDSFSVRLREDIAVNEDVVQTIATDADEPGSLNSQIAYSISSGNEQGKFRIDSSSGQIEVASALDFETTTSYSLVVTARDMGTPVMSGTASVAIAVQNVNENPPTLSGNQNVNVSEATPTSTIIAIFSAVDQDQDTVDYTITAGNGDGKFMIDSGTGVITLVQSLDFETTTQYVLTIRASDGMLSADATLTVNVLDENEHAPVFEGPTTFRTPEEQPAGELVGTVRATDADRNAIVTYSFVQQDRATSLFVLNSNSGQITTAEQLDREVLEQVFPPETSSVTLEVSARDNGSPARRTVQSFTITLVDINDNNPLFADASFSNSLRENLPMDQEVFRVTATDADIGSNGEVDYSFQLASGSNLFEVDSAGVLTTTGPLDCETQAMYTFTITARDRGTPSLSNTTTGVLTVIDENDNSPIFNQTMYVAAIRENVQIRSDITTVNATDLDKGLNGEVEYRIDADPLTEDDGEVRNVLTRFSVDPTSGLIQNINEINFESASQYNVTVIANDRGTPQRSSSVQVVVNIINVDERSPSFVNCPFSVNVLETIAVNSSVVVCEARDRDSTAVGNEAQIQYSFDSPTSLFEINSSTGEIRTLAVLDREASNTHLLRVRVTDLAGRFARRDVRIILSDVNDQAPQFLNTPYSFDFSSSSLTSVRQFLTVSAIDDDAGMNGTFEYSIGQVMRPSNTETSVEVVARDFGTPTQLNSSETVMVTFAESCQLQSYSITPSTGELSVALLCSVEVTPSPSLSVALGMSSDLTCRITTNAAVSYQKIHNGTSVTPPQVIPNGQLAAEGVRFRIEDAGFSDAGDYACLATTVAGSLQTTAVRADLLVPPSIATPPENTAAAMGSAATFTCSASGIPPPTIRWFRADDTQVGEGQTLTLEGVSADDAGMFTCRASNEAGMVTASAQLAVFEAFNVIEFSVSDINSPSADGECQQFDSAQLEETLSELTNQRAVVTDIQGGEGLRCEDTPCSPNPCTNGGSCSLQDGAVGGYQCACRSGFSGKNCDVDEDECDQDPCGANGMCMNTKGSYLCSCLTNYTGRDCQLLDTCSRSSNLCSQGERCLDTFSASGYDCLVIDEMASLVVSGSSQTPGQLNDMIQAFIEANLALRNSRRRRRQTDNTTPTPTPERLTTACEPRFVTLTESSTSNEGSLVLLWVCPEGEPLPSPEDQQLLCQYLFELGAVSSCKLPGEEDFVEAPTDATLPTIDSIKVSVIMVDEDTNRPVTGADGVKLLEEGAAEEALADVGLSVSSSFVAPVAPPPPTKGPEEVSSSSGPIAGGIVVGLIVLAVVVGVIVVVVVLKKKDHRNQQERKKAQALQMITLENGKGSNGDSKGPSSITLSGSMDVLLDNMVTPPQRPPKPDTSSKEDLSNGLDESIYQNVTRTELNTMTKSAVPGPSTSREELAEDNDYDMLPSKAQPAADGDENDYDLLPPAKKPPPNPGA